MQFRNVIIVSHIDIPQKVHVRFNRPIHTHQFLFEIFSTGEDPKFEVNGGASIRQGGPSRGRLEAPMGPVQSLVGGPRGEAGPGSWWIFRDFVE